MIRTVLFDFDGTLADTAPDLGYALNTLLKEENRAPIDAAQIRGQASHGARGLIELGFGIGRDDARFEGLRQRFIDLYADNICRHTVLFPGIREVLQTLSAQNRRWGIVTNKPAFLTDDLVKRLGIADLAGCVVSGDTTANRKPHPEPLLHGCAKAGGKSHECLYVGDAERDIEAGRRAGMKTLVAMFGYLGPNDKPASWGADGAVHRPQEILDWLAREDGIA